MTIDMSQFYQVFFEEAGEHLANMESLLLALDVDNPSIDDLNAIFRAAHSIKGGSGTFGFTDMTEVTHILETLLDRLRKSELALRPAMVDAFLAAGDVLRGQLEHHQGGPEVAREDITEICDRLGTLAADAPDTSAPTDSTPASATGARHRLLECALPADIAADSRVVDDLLSALAEVAACEIRHRPEGSDPRLVVAVDSTRSDNEIKELFAFHLTPEDVRLHPDQPEEDFGFFEAAPGAPEPAYGFFEPLDVETPDTDSGYGFFEGAPGSAPPAAEGDGYGFFQDMPGAPAPISATVIEEAGFGLFADAPGSEHAIQAMAESAPEPARTPSVGRRVSDNPELNRAPSGRRATDKVVVSGSEASSIRVSVEKVDQLINLVGELVITQAMIADAAGYLDPVQAEKLLSGIDLLARNTRDLQE
jgi:two-component system chemotaxis sensor kinase CheA